MMRPPFVQGKVYDKALSIVVGEKSMEIVFEFDFQLMYTTTACHILYEVNTSRTSKKHLKNWSFRVTKAFLCISTWPGTILYCCPRCSNASFIDFIRRMRDLKFSDFANLAMWIHIRWELTHFGPRGMSLSRMNRFIYYGGILVLVRY